MNYNKIQEIIIELLPLLEKYDTGNINYQIGQLKVAVEVLNSDILESEKDIELHRIGKALYPTHGGLTDFNVWVEDGEQRIAINKPIGDLSDQLWNLIK
jgi:hypothetical protein